MNIDSPHNLYVTNHAIARYRERVNYKGTDMDAANLIRQALVKAREWQLKEEHRVSQMLRHDCQPARYFRKKDMIIVVAGRDILTIHDGLANKWKPMELA